MSAQRVPRPYIWAVWSAQMLLPAPSRLRLRVRAESAIILFPNIFPYIVLVSTVLIEFIAASIFFNNAILTSNSLDCTGGKPT